MFRVTKDPSRFLWQDDIYYLHKKFLWFWLKVNISKDNQCFSAKDLYLLMKKGKINIDSREHSNYFYITHKNLAEIKYYDDAKDFKLKNAECFI